MRIAFYAPRASHVKPGDSGDRVFLRLLLPSLQERGHQIQIVSKLNVRDFWRGQVPARRLITEAMAVHREMKRFAPDAWLVFGTSVKNPDLFGWWQHPKRYVLLHTDAGTEEALPEWWQWFVAAHRQSLARADKVTAWRPKNLDQLRAFGVPVDKLSLLAPGVKIPEALPSRADARRRLGLPQEAPILLCVSRLSGPRTDGKPWKTEWILTLLEALALAPLPADALFVLVGDGPGRSRVEEHVAKLKLQERVRLVGEVPNDDVHFFYAACDFFAYAPLTDRIFTTILEAQACERPVVTLRTRSAELTVEDGRTGLLANDLQEFQTHLAALAHDRARCAAMGQAAREYVARFHSIETRVTQIEDLLRCGA